MSGTPTGRPPADDRRCTRMKGHGGNHNSVAPPNPYYTDAARCPYVAPTPWSTTGAKTPLDVGRDINEELRAWYRRTRGQGEWFELSQKIAAAIDDATAGLRADLAAALKREGEAMLARDVAEADLFAARAAAREARERAIEECVRVIEALPVIGIATWPYSNALKAARDALRALAPVPTAGPKCLRPDCNDEAPFGFWAVGTKTTEFFSPSALGQGQGKDQNQTTHPCPNDCDVTGYHVHATWHGTSPGQPTPSILEEWAKFNDSFGRPRATPEPTQGTCRECGGTGRRPELDERYCGWSYCPCPAGRALTGEAPL